MIKPRKPLGDYEVGKYKPPAEHRFKKGQCGNPKGRLKKTLDVKKIYEEAAGAKVTVIVDGRKVKMTKIEAAIHTNVNKAAKGDLRALIHALSELQRFGIGLGVPDAGTGQVPVSDFYASLIERALTDRMPVVASDGATTDQAGTDAKDDET